MVLVLGWCAVLCVSVWKKNVFRVGAACGVVLRCEWKKGEICEVENNAKDIFVVCLAVSSWQGGA